LGKPGIETSNVKIYYFDREESDQATSYTEAEISSEGRLMNRPIGFGDQLGKDLRKLL
jgi:hypothetical protein